MTFKEIKQGNTLYVLDKNGLTVKTCKVRAVSFPHLDLRQQPTQGLVVDVTLEMDGKTATYVMNETASVAYAGGLVFATEPQVLCPTVEIMKQEAEQILSSVERQKDVLAKADTLLTELNPALRERQEAEKRFRTLENGFSSVSEKMDKLLRIMERKTL